MLGRLRPGLLGNDGVRKYALRAGNAARRVIRLVGGNRIAELLRKLIGKKWTTHRTVERVGLVDEVT